MQYDSPHIGKVMDVVPPVPWHEYERERTEAQRLGHQRLDNPLMHIPVAGSFAMALVIGHESINLVASQTVFCDVTKLSTLFYYCFPN